MRRLFVLTAAMAMVITSCKKYEVSEPLDFGSLDYVALKGTVYANLDETVSDLQFAPTGTIVRVSVPYSAYDASNTSDGRHVVETTVGAKGEYSINVPVVAKGVNATISFMDFTAKIKRLNSVGQEEIAEKHFRCNSITVPNLGRGRGEGDYIKIDAQYYSNAVNPNDTNVIPQENLKTVSVSGKLEYLKIDSSGFYAEDVYVAVPDGTKITAVITLTDAGGRTYKETKLVKVTAGVYTLSVPMVERGTASVKLYSEEFWDITIAGTPDTKELWRHVLDKVVTAYNVATQTYNLRYDAMKRIQ